MIFETITPNGIKMAIPDMHGELSQELTPFAVRGPNFVELNLYRDIKYRTFDIADLVKLCD